MWFVCSKNSHFIVLLFMEWSIKMCCLYFQWCNLWLSINSEETFDTSRYCYFVAWQVEGYVYGYVLRFVKKLILRTSMILHLNTELNVAKALCLFIRLLFEKPYWYLCSSDDIDWYEAFPFTRQSVIVISLKDKRGNFLPRKNSQMHFCIKLIWCAFAFLVIDLKQYNLRSQYWKRKIQRFILYPRNIAKDSFMKVVGLLN